MTTIKSSKEKTIFTVSLVNGLTNIFLAIIKIVIGLIGFSQALVADGVHSFSDVISDLLVYFAAKASTQLPDKEHPYGHQRIETIGTMMIALILVIVAVSIAYDALTHLITHQHERPTAPVVIAAALSIVINEGLFYYSLKQGKKIDSGLLISNAWHKRSDVLVSLVVLVSVIGAMIGVAWLDSVGALFVTILIFKIAIQMLWRAGQELIDRAVDPDILDHIQKTIYSVCGVRQIHQLRTRLHGNSIFVDLHIIVDPFITVSEGHHIGDTVHNALLNQIKNIRDVTVHVDSENDETSHPSLDLPDRKAIEKILENRWYLLPHYQAIKKINLHYLSGKLSIEVIFKEKISSAEIAQYREKISDLIYLSRVDFYYAE